MATEGVLYAMIIFAPWAFGATQEWSMWVLNGLGVSLGGLLLAQWIIRWQTGFAPLSAGGETQPVAGESKPAILR